MVYPYNGKIVLLISLLLGLFQFVVLITLEPFGTDRYEDAHAHLKLLGYTFCFVLPFMMVYALERRVLAKLDNLWNPILELGFKVLLTALIAISSYFYNIYVVNSIAPSLYNALSYISDYFLPNMLVFLPLILLVYFFLFKKKGKLKIKGENKGDILSLHPDSFIYAVAQQNYVTIYYDSNFGVKKCTMRSTLKNLEEQLLDVLRIHKSYIINVNYIERFVGGQKDRFVFLEQMDRPLPVSRHCDVSRFLK